MNVFPYVHLYKTANLGHAEQTVRLADNLAGVVNRPSHSGPESRLCRRTYPLSPNRIMVTIRVRRTMAHQAFCVPYGQTEVNLALECS